MNRAVEFILALLISVTLLPLAVVIVLLIMIFSPGNPLFSQTRVGRNEQLFKLYKFRSMVLGAENLGGHSTMPGDQRVTPIGRILRKTSLDELPQLLNVIKGDMSLVGPRPDVPVQREHYSESEWKKRHIVRPGITGLAQATVRSQTTIEERKSLDFQYVDNRSTLLDLKILVMTVNQVLFKGSH